MSDVFCQKSVISSENSCVGIGPNFTSVLADNPHALVGQTSSKIITNHLNAIHAAQAAFLESEAREERQRAIREKTGTTSLVYELEDIVYFNRENSNHWKGPGTVIG